MTDIERHPDGNPVAYCIEGCGRKAVGSRFEGITRDGEEITEAVCAEHAGVTA